MGQGTSTMNTSTDEMTELELHRERLQARESLAHDVELLVEKLSPSAIVDRRLNRWSRWMRMQKAQARDQLEETVEGVGQSVQGFSRSTVQMARERTRQMPLAVGAACFALGWGLSRLIPMSRPESKVLQPVNQSLTEKAAPIVEEAKTVVSESTKEAIAHR